MNKYERLIDDLEKSGTGKMKCFGNSMKPIIDNGSLLTFVKRIKYQIGDIVFCKVKGNYIDAHKVLSTSEDRGYLIGNNRGFQNGWTHTVYGCVSEINGQSYKRKIVINEKVGEKFAILINSLYQETSISSLITSFYYNKNYKAIIGLGEEVLPFIYIELAKSDDELVYWLPAIEQILNHRFDRSEKQNDFYNHVIEYGKQCGYIN